MPNFNAWLDTFIAEKGLDTGHTYEVIDQHGWNHFIPLAVVLDAIKATTPAEQAAIKRNLVLADFVNRDVVAALAPLALALANRPEANPFVGSEA